MLSTSGSKNTDRKRRSNRRRSVSTCIARMVEKEHKKKKPRTLKTEPKTANGSIPTRCQRPSLRAAAEGCRSRSSSRRTMAQGPGAGGWTCTWGRGSLTGPRCPQRPGWQSGGSRGCSRGVRRRAASDAPRRRRSTGSGACLGTAPGSQSASCSPGCQPGWASASWVTWRETGSAAERMWPRLATPSPIQLIAHY